MKYDMGIEESLDKIFSGILTGEISPSLETDTKNKVLSSAREYLPRFKSLFPSNIFQDEYAIFYAIIDTHKIDSFSVNQLDTIIDTNRDLILDSPYVDLSTLAKIENGASTTDDEKIMAIKANMNDKLTKLSNAYVDANAWNSACNIYIEWFRWHYMLETGHNIVRIMSDDGYKEKEPNKHVVTYSGCEDAKRYFNKRIRVINELSSISKIKSTVLDSAWYLDEQEKENNADDKALMTIGIPSIDKVMGDLRRSNMIGILGPPKGGKTRFTNFLVQRALSLGLNVCVWPLEGTKEEWEAMQTAAFIARKNNLYLNSKDILQRKFDNPQVKSLVSAAKFQMVSDASYGRLSFIEGAAYCEDFISVLESHYDNDNPFDVIVIDSLVNILSKTGRAKTDRISSAYMELKDFIANKLSRPALAIVPAQLKQDIVDKLRKNPTDTIDVTAGGESAETIRTPDEVLGLFSTKEERAAGQIKIYSVASRHSGNFDDMMIKAHFECCHFSE